MHTDILGLAPKIGAGTFIVYPQQQFAHSAWANWVTGELHLANDLPHFLLAEQIQLN